MQNYRPYLETLIQLKKNAVIFPSEICKDYARKEL